MKKQQSPIQLNYKKELNKLNRLIKQAQKIGITFDTPRKLTRPTSASIRKLQLKQIDLQETLKARRQAKAEIQKAPRITQTEDYHRKNTRAKHKTAESLSTPRVPAETPALLTPQQRSERAKQAWQVRKSKIVEAGTYEQWAKEQQLKLFIGRMKKQFETGKISDNIFTTTPDENGDILEIDLSSGEIIRKVNIKDLHKPTQEQLIEAAQKSLKNPVYGDSFQIPVVNTADMIISNYIQYVEDAFTNVSDKGRQEAMENRSFIFGLINETISNVVNELAENYGAPLDMLNADLQAKITAYGKQMVADALAEDMANYKITAHDLYSSATFTQFLNVLTSRFRTRHFISDELADELQDSNDDIDIYED